MLSTFKFPVALAVLHQLDQQGLPLTEELFIPKSSLHPNTYSPLQDTHPEGDFNISVGELLKYSVSLSDNNACDILIQYLGGIKNIQSYIQKLGIRDMQITATEHSMHQKFEYQNLNKTQPSSAAVLLEKFIKKELLSPVYQNFLEKIMTETSTGPDKLKGLLPPGVIVGHKTGSSDRNAAGLKIADNDMGFVRLPDGRYYTIAVFVTNSMESDKTNASIIAQISKVVYDYFNR